MVNILNTMKMKKGITIALITLSVLFNAYFLLYQGAFTIGYINGSNAQATAIGNQIISSINKDGKLTIQTPDGAIVLIPEQTTTETDTTK